MLNEEITEKLVERLVSRIEQVNVYTLKKIGQGIKKVGTLSPSNVHRLSQIIKYGADYDEITKKLAEVTELNIKDIYKIFEEVAKRDYKFAEQFYKYKNVKYIPWEENEALQRQVRSLARVTAGEYYNLSKTLAFAKTVNGVRVYDSVAQTYQNVIDEAVIAVYQGKDTFDEQMFKTIKELGQSGIKTVDYETGKSMRLDSAVRMNMQGALRDLQNEMQRQFGEEFGSDGVEITVHAFPADDHADAQGRQFSKNEYVKLQTFGSAKDYTGKRINMHLHRKNGAEYDTFRPISKLNCYHRAFSIVLGVNAPEYSEKQLQEIKEKNEAGFMLDGKHYTMYQGTQMQRRLETAIRRQKDAQILAKSAENKQGILESQQKITELTTKYNEFCNISGLKRKPDRLRVPQYKRVAVK